MAWPLVEGLFAASLNQCSKIYNSWYYQRPLAKLCSITNAENEGFCMHVDEIKLFNVIKFHQISPSGLAIIMGQKSAKIRFFAVYAVKIFLCQIRQLHWSCRQHEGLETCFTISE